MTGRYKAYPEYRKSMIEWMHDVPVHWCNVPLKYMAIKNNSLFSDGDWIESKDISNEGIRYITTGNVGEGIYKEQGSGFISDETFKKLACTEVFEGDLLLSRLNAPIGRACIVPNLSSRIVTSVDNVIFRPDSLYNKQFLVYLFSSASYFKHTSNLARGATMQRISGGLLGNIRVVVPPLLEQHKIANFLDYETAKIDTLIAKQERLIELLKEKRQAVISHAVTKGLNPDAPMKDSGVEWLGEVPEHWGVGALKHIVKQAKNSMVDGPFGSSVNTDEDYVDSGVPVVRTVNITNNGFSFSNLMFMREAKFQELQRHSVHPNDVLFSKVGTIGNACLLPENVPEAILSTTGSCKITVENTQYLPLFLVWVIQSMNQQLMLIANSNVQPFLNMSNIKNLIIPMPDVYEQKNIIETTISKVAKIDNAISKSEQLSSSLKESKTALISAAVTGKIDVRDWKPADNSLVEVA